MIKFSDKFRGIFDTAREKLRAKICKFNRFLADIKRNWTPLPSMVDIVGGNKIWNHASIIPSNCRILARNTTLTKITPPKAIQK